METVLFMHELMLDFMLFVIFGVLDHWAWCVCVCVCVCVSQNELRPAYEDFLLKKQEKAKKKKKEEVNCTLMYKTIRLYALTNEFII